jgi:hypothetical protein
VRVREFDWFSKVRCDLRSVVRTRLWLSAGIAFAASLMMSASAVATTRSVIQTDGTPAPRGDQLTLNPAAYLQPELPQGTRVTIMASPSPIDNLPSTRGPRFVSFRVTGANGSKVRSPVVAKLTPRSPGGLDSWATFSYTDKAGVGIDTVTATMYAGGAKLTGSTTITWTRPALCPVGLPSLFRALKCSSAARMVATVVNGGECLGLLASAGELADAIRAGTTLSAALRAAGGSLSIARLAVDLRALRTSGLTVSGLVKAVRDGKSVGRLIKNLWRLVNVAVAQGATSEKIASVASALAALAGFGPCVDLIEDTSRPAPPPPSPILAPVSLGTLCQNNGVSIDAVNGCPYIGSSMIGAASFDYAILIENNNDSVSPTYWDLIDFPATSCRSITLTFGMPTDGSEPGDTASIEVITQSQAPQAASVSYGNIATLTATLDGGRWSLENSATNADDEIAVNGTASCTSATGY